MQVGSRMLRNGRLLPDGDTSTSPGAVDRQRPGRGASRLSSRPSGLTVTSLGYTPLVVTSLGYIPPVVTSLGYTPRVVTSLGYIPLIVVTECIATIAI